MVFRLDPAFVASYAEKVPPFGFNGLGELVYLRTYSRVKENGEKEKWFETIERVVNGCYNMQKDWIEAHSLGWNELQAQESAQEMFTRAFEMKWLPPGRGLWCLGSPITEEKKLYAALNYCGFVSTADIGQGDPSKPFRFVAEHLMLGIGLGYDVKGAGKLVIKKPLTEEVTYVVEDSREGWVEAISRLLDSYFLEDKPTQRIDYSLVRPMGVPIKGFGGLASGPAPLRELIESCRTTLDAGIGKPLTVTNIVDIMNYISMAVVSGNVRRSAQISFGEANDDEFIDLKNYQKNPQRQGHGWASNNSIFAEIGMDYTKIAKSIAINGEPGVAWLDNMREFSRMNGVSDYKDSRVSGGNPCLEQSLESYELCCLVETFPSRATDREDYLRTLKFAYLYAKTVTLGKSHWPETNRVLLRNRRIGCSMSGIAQFIAKYGVEELRQWCQEGYEVIGKYDTIYSNFLAIPKSIKTTSIKPSGSVSLLSGCTAGMHYPESRYYIRRVRLAENSALVPGLQARGYFIEKDHYSPNTVVVEFPIDAGEGVRIQKDVTMWEQLALAAFLQRHWADNQVSCTVTFDPETEGPHIAAALNYYQYELKGISFLPRLKSGAYSQMPYEAITVEVYQAKMAALKSSGQALVDNEDAESEKYCDGDKCVMPR